MNVLICQKPLAFKQARKTSLTMLAELKVQLVKKAAASAQLQLPGSTPVALWGQTGHHMPQQFP